LFFLLKALLIDSIATFFIFSNATYISSLVFLTLAYGFYGFSFRWNLLKSLQYQGWLTSVLVPLILLDMLIPPI
jgi:ABC-type transport system involved in cytochrome c biogenesis permease component